MAMSMAERWLTVSQIANHLSVAPITIYRWLERDKIPSHRVGRQWRFKASEVDDWVMSGEAREEEKKPVRIGRNG